jgi:hypothetical protein
MGYLSDFQNGSRLFVLTFLSCSKKVSQTASGRRAGCGLKKGMDAGVPSTCFDDKTANPSVSTTLLTVCF